MLPLATANNFLSGWGLGGAQPLATAKASLCDLRRLSIRVLTNLFWYICAKVFEGVRGNFFQKVPPQTRPLFRTLLS